jgi:drug/metabolite transporter (DMT)-like permease
VRRKRIPVRASRNRDDEFVAARIAARRRREPLNALQQHRRAVALMVVAATLWSIAGVVTRHLTPALQAEGRFEITFWRSLFAALTVAGYFVLVRREGLRPVRATGWPGLVSGAMWAVMFVCFMVALTLTTVANTLLVMSIGPLLTAVLARIVLRTPVRARTWLAISAAMLGMAWMFARGGGALPGGNHVAGMLIALAVPLAAAINLVLLQKTRARVDLVPAVFLGGAISAAIMLPLALPLHAAPRDVALLAVLGVFQLGLPCMLMVVAARRLSAPEISLLALLEVVLGPLWAWLGAGEVPATGTIAGGLLVLAALVANEAMALRERGR